MPIKGMKLADKLGKRKDEIRKLYKSGKKKIVVDGVKFSIRRGGPSNNFLIVSPTEKERLTPILNFEYDMKVEEKRLQKKMSERMRLPQDFPHWAKRKMAKQRGK